MPKTPEDPRPEGIVERPKDPRIGGVSVRGRGRKRVAVELNFRPDVGVVYRTIKTGPANNPTSIRVEMARVVSQAPIRRRAA